MSELKMIKDLLDFDPIDTAEKLCKGEHDPGPLAFAFNMQKGAMLKQLLQGFDTYFGSSFQEVIDVLKKIGFVLEYEEHFEHYEDKHADTLQLYIHEQYTMFALLESYNTTHTNKCHVYFLIRRPKTKEEFDALFYCRMSHEALDYFDRETKELVERQEIFCDLDGREALTVNLSGLKDLLETKPISRKLDFLWLLNYTEEHDERIKDFSSTWYYKRSFEKLMKCKSYKRIFDIPKKSLFQKIKSMF
jgi:hypothetical protein